MGGGDGIGDQEVEVDGQNRREPSPGAGAQGPFPLRREGTSDDQQQVEIGAGAGLASCAGAKEHQGGRLGIATQLGQRGRDPRVVQPRAEIRRGEGASGQRFPASGEGRSHGEKRRRDGGSGATAPVGSQRHQSSLKNLPCSWTDLGPGGLIHVAWCRRPAKRVQLTRDEDSGLGIEAGVKEAVRWQGR